MSDKISAASAKAHRHLLRGAKPAGWLVARQADWLTSMRSLGQHEPSVSCDGREVRAPMRAIENRMATYFIIMSPVAQQSG